MRIGILSDTHAPRFWKQCPPAVAGVLESVDVVLHAGDICTADVLDELRAFAPVYAVLGNNDKQSVVDRSIPETLEMTFEGVRVAMLHDGGDKVGRFDRLRKRFPSADIVVFGHSHFPLHEADEEFHIFNPGSPTDKRRQPHKTMGVVDVEDGAIVDVRILEVD